MARQNHKKFMRRYRWQSGACLDCGKLYSETELTAPERWRLRNAFWAARRQNNSMSGVSTAAGKDR